LRLRFRFALAGTAMLICIAVPAFDGAVLAQAVPRIKAKIVSVDGDVLTLQPVIPPQQATPAAPRTKSGTPAAGSASAGPVSEPDKPADALLIVSVLPDTRYVATAVSSFATIKVGDYVGAAVSERSSGQLRAQEIFLYAEALRGTGEGRFSDNGRLLVNGAVSAVQPASAQDTTGGTLTVHYRGAVITAVAKGRALCEGRAAPLALMSALACAADTTIDVPSGTPVSAVTVGDKSLLVPGAMVSVAIAKTADGKQVTPGMTVEKPQSTQ
jgi:hypothetical protein